MKLKFFSVPKAYHVAKRIHAKNKLAFEKSWWFKEYKNKTDEAE